MFCSKCGSSNSESAAFCSNCGSSLSSGPTQQTILVQQQLPPAPSRDTAGLLAIFLGIFGAHDFYVGRSGEGVIKLILTIFMIGSPIVAIWNLINIIQILTGSYHDKWNRPLSGNATFTKLFIILYILIIVAIIVGCVALCTWLLSMFA